MLFTFNLKFYKVKKNVFETIFKINLYNVFFSGEHLKLAIFLIFVEIFEFRISGNLFNPIMEYFKNQNLSSYKTFCYLEKYRIW